ncbi:DUF6609 family protein [Bacillus sp. S/N-304-OC-R1]|uniref:DUF6609 family protein n=1 Tax=Bacillus sp. S/N-304-OC-R1 TaxID=2758034 RepID=UPI001C8EB824|nr:DUF6609 family protein [Bacillus sp. S/N-304-OC-R1]MBY0121573.1 hypothetical protein [Bacillus sp. S/N-304-OC-R1]
MNYPYPRQRIFGIFLIAVGLTMGLSTIFGTDQFPQVLIFLIGYILSLVGIMFNSRLRRKLAIGEATAKQEKVSKLSLIFVALACGITGSVLNGSNDYRLIWMLILLFVGLHFIPFIVVHGKFSLLLGILTTLNACFGLILPNISFYVFGAIDSIIKILIGILLIKYSPNKQSIAYDSFALNK